MGSGENTGPVVPSSLTRLFRSSLWGSEGYRGMPGPQNTIGLNTCTALKDIKLINLCGVTFLLSQETAVLASSGSRSLTPINWQSRHTEAQHL